MLSSTARNNSRETNKQPMVRIVEIELLDTGYYALNGNCGHRIHVIRKSLVPEWEQRIQDGRNRKRCYDCAHPDNRPGILSAKK